MATFEVTRGSERYRISLPDDQADAVTPERIRALLDSAGQPTEQQSAEPTGAGLSALQYGARQGARGLASTARVMGEALDNDWLRRQGRELDDAVPEPRGYVPSGPALVRAIRDGRYGDAVRDLPGAVAEAVPGMGATMAAGAAGAAIGGPVTGLAAAGMTSAAQTFGDVAEQRAANDGVSSADPGNMLAAAGTTAGIAALDAIGARGAGRALGAPRGLLERTSAAARGAIREGVTEGAQEAAQEAGTTLGTREGLTIDPAQVAASGLVGAGAGGIVRLPGAVVRGGGESALDAATAGDFRHMSPTQAASVLRVNDVLDQERASVRERTGRDPDPADVLGTVRGDLATGLRTLVRQAEQAGWLDQPRQREGTALRELIAQAEHTDRELGSGLDRLDALARAPADFRTGIRDLLTDLDVVSRAARSDNTGGLFERVGRAVGGAAGLAAGIGAGPVGVTMSALAAAGGTSIGARVGAGAGRMLDRSAGAEAPAVARARRRAEAVLHRTGMPAGSTGETREALRRLLTNERLAARAALGLPTDTDTMARLATAAAARTSLPPHDAGASAATDASSTEAVIQRAKARAAAQGPRASTQAPPEALAPPPLPMHQAGSETPPASLREAAGADLDSGPMGGGRRYVRAVLSSKGDNTPTTDADIHAAVDRLAEAGALMRDEADALKAARGDWPRALAQRVAIEVARLRGYDPRELPDVVPDSGGASGAPFYRPDVRDQASWQGAADARQEHVRFYRQKALEAGDTGLAEALSLLGTATDRQMTPQQRRAVARAVLEAAPPEHAALRRAAMVPWLRSEDGDALSPQHPQ